jgi:hypothetical protein
MLGSLASLVTLAAGPLFTFTPPPGFHPDPTLADLETGALALTGDGDREPHLVGFYDDGQGPQAASVAISVVDGPLDVEANQRPTLAATTTSYFRTALDLSFELDHTSAVGHGSTRRIEVWGHTLLDDQRRTTVVSYFPGVRHHSVVVASLPASREAQLTPLLGAALDTFSATDPPEPWARSQTAISLAVWGAAGLALAAAGVTRRRAARPDRGKG